MFLTYLEVDDNDSYDHGGDQVAQVWSVLTVEGLSHSVPRSLLDQEVEGSDDSSFELGALVGSDGHGREALPQDELTDVGGDEEGDT